MGHHKISDGHKSRARSTSQGCPSYRLFVECDGETEQTDAFAKLSADGQVLMELADHGFSRVSDRFGVSWQLSLA